MSAHRIAQLALVESEETVNERVAVLDSRRVRVAARDFELDAVFLPMSTAELFVESGLDYALARPLSRGGSVAVVYYGAADAGKDAAALLFACAQALTAVAGGVQLSAYGFYRDRRVALAAPQRVARSAGGVRELLLDALPAHERHAQRASGRAHAVFRFEAADAAASAAASAAPSAAAGAVYVYLVDGLPNALRGARARLTTRADDLASAVDRPGLAMRLLRTVRAELGPAAPVVVVAHCPLAAAHRYALADALRFADEWQRAEHELPVSSGSERAPQDARKAKALVSGH